MRLSTGRRVSACALAAGATRSENTSSTPVIWLIDPTAMPSISRNALASARTGTPRASAASGSIDANSNGRPIASRSASVRAASAASASSWPSAMPSRLPNRSPSRSPSTVRPELRSSTLLNESDLPCSLATLERTWERTRGSA